MKILKKVATGIVIIYVLLVVAFESLLGYNQPEFEGTVVLTTTNDNGDFFDRVLAGLVTNDTLYVRVNHWPRAWYYRLLENPNVQVTLDGETKNYLAIEVTGDEYDTVQRDHDAGLAFRIMTGFPPRHIIRFDPL